MQRNRADVTSNLFRFQATNYMISLPSLLHFYALLEGFSRDAPQLWSLQPSWWPLHFQNRSPWWSPWAWGKEKVTQSKIRWIERIFLSVWNCQMLITASLDTFQTCPNLKWQSSKNYPFSYLADLQLFKLSTGNCHTPSSLPVWRWPQSYWLKSFCSWSYLSPTHDLFWSSKTHWPIRLRLHNTSTVSLQRSKTPPTSILDMTLNNLMVRL